MILPNLSYEIELWNKGFSVIGIDEVGRGAFAGPVCVGGVIFPAMQDLESIKRLESLGINDSKKLKAPKRKLLSKVIQDESLAYYVSTIDVAEINRIGIGKATFMAMRQVVKHLCENLKLRGGATGGPPTSERSKHAFASTSGGGEERQDPERAFVLVDGFNIKNLPGIGIKNQTAIIHGDSISLSIAAASIIAKVYRDELMESLSEEYANYGWDQNKGYGTLLHRQALQKFGPTPLHRTDFIENFI